VGVWRFSGNWRTEFYVLLCVVCWSFCVEVWCVQQGVVYWIVFTSVCWEFDIVCGSVRDLDGNIVLNWNILLCVGSWTFLYGSLRGSAESSVLIWNVFLCVGSWTFCVGLWGRQQVIAYWCEIFCCVLLVGHFVWECDWVSRKWRTEFYVLLCVGSWTFYVGVWGGLQEVAYWILCTVVCGQLDIMCGTVWVSAGSVVLICMYCCVLAVGRFVWECEGVSRE